MAIERIGPSPSGSVAQFFDHLVLRPPRGVRFSPPDAKFAYAAGVFCPMGPDLLRNCAKTAAPAENNELQASANIPRSAKTTEPAVKQIPAKREKPTLQRGKVPEATVTQR